MFLKMCFVLKIHVGYPVLPTFTNVFYLIDLPRIIVCFIFNNFRVFLSSILFNFVSFCFHKTLLQICNWGKPL